MVIDRHQTVELTDRTPGVPPLGIDVSVVLNETSLGVVAVNVAANAESVTVNVMVTSSLAGKANGEFVRFVNVPFTTLTISASPSSTRA